MNISIYDNQGKSLDSITIVFNNTKRDKSGNRYKYDCIASSKSGFGFFMHSECIKGKHLGKKISFNQLENSLQKILKQYFKDYY